MHRKRMVVINQRLNYLNLIKIKIYQGSYGVDGYGVYGYGTVKVEVVAAVETVTAYAGVSYYIECDYNNENRSFKIYFYKHDESKPSTPIITYIGDTAFDYGQCRFICPRFKCRDK